MMSMDLDAEAEMEGLFGGEDQAATQSLTQEERDAGEANLDVTGAAEGEGGEKKKKTVIRKPIPKLDNERIMGARGVHTLEELFADFQPRGKGHEFEDLDLVMKKMEHWAHRLFPKLPFNSVLDIIANRLGKRKVVQTHVKKIRLGMLQQASKDEEVINAAEEEEEREVERYGEGGEDEEEVEDFFANMTSRQVLQPAPPVRSAPVELTEEQKERMRKNKEMAAAKRREKEEREALEKRAREDEEDEEEMEREMLTGGNASEWGPSSEVEASCLKTVQELNLKSQQSKKSLDPKSEGSILAEDVSKEGSSAEKLDGSTDNETHVTELKDTENDPSNVLRESAKAVQDDIPLAETNDDDLSLAQMMEEMEEQDMQGEVVNKPVEDNVISLDQMMHVMEED